jgi:hypothetical protein
LEVALSSSLVLVASGTDGPAVLGISGARVVVAAMVDQDVVVRRSGDGGERFRASQTVLRAETPCCLVAVPNSIDVRAGRVLLEAARVYADAGGGVSLPRRLVSTDGGAHWTKVKLGGDGTRVGAWSGASGTPRLMEAWDNVAGSEPQQIRFRRQL